MNFAVWNDGNTGNMLIDWLIAWQQTQWLEVISRQQDGSYNVELMREEQESLDYSYSE